ncbi:hypothetical protein RJ640_018106 [Escallonia rubra]|uniref:Integrase catalytic domain-containing protein n=1 Tax=Escallonia rubra TaxID=112253 RepID=A0AA88QUI0_9ASTE|nr:hypothetical protein RJ640_018106 [Escallonia rubra]
MAGKDTNVGASGVVEENVVVERGRDLLPPIGGKKSRSQSKSRDAISSLDGRTCVLEEAMGDTKDRLGFVEQNLQTLEDHVLEELESLKKAVMGEDELRTRFMELFANLQEQLDVEFTTLMLHIPNMTEEDLLFNFIDGLQNWAKQELQRRGVKDLDEAIAVAESLMEYARVGDSSKGKNVQVASKGNHAKGGGDKPKAWNKWNNQAGTNKFEGHGKLEERRAKSKPKDGCFFCGGPHWARDCPRQGKLNALVEENEELEEGDVHMGSLQILNALHAKAVAKVPMGKGQASTGKGLLYVEAKLNGKPAQVMVDTGATHNFVTMEEAKRLGLKVVGGGGWLKSVNTNAKPLQGAARQVEMCLGSWRGLVDFSVAPMDDFKVVIGLDFLRQVNALVSPYSNAVHIMEKGVSCAVPTSGGTSSAKTLASMQLSAMQIVKGVKKGEATYLAALKMEDHVGDSTEPLPRAIEEVLERNKDLAESGQTQRFWVEDGLLYTKGQRAYVPKWNNLRKRIIRECHDTPWAGHPGQRRTYALVEASYYWPQMKDEVEAYVKTCLVCQQDKVENQLPAGLLEPLPIPAHPWESVSMDFITCLPRSEGCGSIMVVVDRFSKYATFVASPADCTAEEAARLFLKNVVKYWGLPKVIVSDRDPRFTGKFWTELFKLLGLELHFSTSFHPQTDGQTERVNALLECYLRHFVSANQTDWARLLDVAQFSYNLMRSEATNQSPFEIAIGQQPLTPLALAGDYKGRSLLAAQVARSWNEQADVARSYLDKAGRKMKKWADKRRRPKEYNLGDMVMLKLLPQQFKSFRKVHKGLIRKYEGPFPIVAKVGKVSYRLELPPKLKIHPVFHVSLLKPHYDDKEDPSRGESHRAPTAVVRSYDKEAEYVLSDKIERRRGVPPTRHYLT